MKAIFAACVMAAVSRAAAEETTQEMKDHDNNCFFCINEGNLFCSADGKSGSCLAASCEEDKLGECKLKEHDCDTSKGLEAMVAFSECQAPVANVEACPTEIVITQNQVESGG